MPRECSCPAWRTARGRWAHTRRSWCCANSTARDSPRWEGRAAFAYFDKGSLATIGRSSAVGEIQGVKLSGCTSWAAWLGIHLLFLLGFRNKVSVLVHWVYSYFTCKRGARVITGVGGGPPANSA